ncbi:platelet endothelial cell adhesion molecule isoform X1 [Larimichthys crocea]|uniref:platelet endothelial cell adhesion molecule isoform X1 n=1 Tax=Larimichthys crocea TaxID=215358 RepID=UPI000F5E9833|nr:platelet endothelial cell adhesion molecule isoform X1 [Larimichthys crocea]
MDSRPPNLLLLLLLHFWQCGRGQSSYIIDQVGLALLPSNTVQSGTPVILSCKVSVSHNNIPDLTHTFQLTRDSVLINSSTTTEDKIEYEINPARAADSGSYECRVTVKDKSRASFSQKLTVTGLQTPVLYLNKTTPYESEEFVAACSAPEEKGVLIFRFYQKLRSREPKTIKQQAVTGNSLETTLALREVGDSLLYCDYEISLVSGARRSNSSDKIQVIVKALMIAPVMNVRPSSDVFEGDALSVVCKVVNPPMNVEVFLTKDRRILKQATTDLAYNFTAQDGDSGELVCKALWNTVQKETYHSITVRELFSKPRLVVEPIDIFEGEHFRLTCSVTIHEPEKINNTMRFTIYKDNVKLRSAMTYDAVAGPSVNGNYSCKAHAATSAHSFVKESKTVVVKTKVHVSKPVLSVVGGTLILGKPFQLLCHSDNGTLPITYVLHSPKQPPLYSVVHKPGERAIFNLSAINKISDINTFICHGKNSQHKTSVTETGHLLRSTNIIEPVTKPVLTMLPRMGDVSEGEDVTLVCSVQRGTLPINFTWYHRKGALAFQTSRELKGSYTINNIKGVDQGEYYCTSTNSANKTEKSDAVRIGVKWAGWKKGLIATFCILFILAMILFLTFKRRLLPVKKKTTGKLSVKSSGTKMERLSLTQTEVSEPANATPGMIGKSIWSEHVSGSESDDQNSVTTPQQPEPQYTEVQTRQADPNRALVKKGTDTVYSEVRNSKQGAPEQADGRDQSRTDTVQ